MELQLKDLETLEKRVEKINRAVRIGDNEAKKVQVVMQRVKEGLEAAQNVRQLDLSLKEREEIVNELQLLTDKPVLYVCNVSESAIKFPCLCAMGIFKYSFSIFLVKIE